MRDSGHVPLCRVQLVCLRLSKGNHQRRLRSAIKPPWHMARFLSSFSYKAAMLPITFVQPASQPAISTVWQMTLTSANTEGFLWLTHAEVDGLQRGYGGRETYSHTESSTVQASRQAGKDRWLTLMPVPFDPLEQMHPLCSLFTNTHKYTHSDIFPLMIGFITFFLLRLESSAILLQSREPWSLLWEQVLNVTTASR